MNQQTANGQVVNPYSGFDHLKFTVTNAKQAASYYCTRLGFQHVAYRGLETGSREVASHVVKQGDAIFVFESPIHPEAQREMAAEIARRGDGVKDVAFTVKDCKAVYEKAIARGAQSIKKPEEYSDEDGTVIMATLATVSFFFGFLLLHELNLYLIKNTYSMVMFNTLLLSARIIRVSFYQVTRILLLL